ncbi:MAG: ATP-binding cassette domain-containing protein, partial [Caldilineaceae bacterium]|nr:ATP-binding cassette domain-containing protein [Caldilineaceae bacterium]
MMDIITGKTRPDDGEVYFDGRTDLTKLDEATIANLGIGRKFQKPTVFESHTVWDNIELALKKPRDVLSALTYTPANDDIERIEEILETIRLSARKGDLAAGLSHGQKQWLEIAMLLAQEPKLVLLDEPVAGMTRRERDRTGELVQEVAKRCSVLVVEHDMEFVRNYANIVSVLHLGSLLTEGPVAQVQSDPEVIEVYIGRSR